MVFGRSEGILEFLWSLNANQMLELVVMELVMVNGNGIRIHRIVCC